jgi:hypothetical protein
LSLAKAGSFLLFLYHQNNYNNLVNHEGKWSKM